MMLRGLWKLTWLELKIFMREPLGAIGTIVVPVVLFLALGRVAGRTLGPSSLAATGFVHVGVPVLASVLIAVSSVLSLVTIISIYREGGILRRLRATPLRPQTILTAHVLVKLALTLATTALMILAIVALLAGVVAFYWYEEDALSLRLAMVGSGVVAAGALAWISWYGREFWQFAQAARVELRL